MKVSIITTVYKAEKDLPRLLDSMMAQKSPELEFFLIDNGSPDKCGEICREYMKKDSRFVLYELKDNIGYIRARNLAVTKCDGDYVGFCDSDDYLEPGGYAHAVSILKSREIDLYLAAYNTVEGENIVKSCNPYDCGLYTEEMIMEKILPQAFGPIYGKDNLHGFAWKQIFRKSVLVDNNLKYMPELQPYEDQILNLEIIRVCNSIYVDDCVIYNYVVNPQSITAKLIKNFNLEEEWKRLVLFYESKKKYVDNEIHLEALSNQMLNFSYSMILSYCKKYPSVLAGGNEFKELVDQIRLKEMVSSASKNQSLRNRLVYWCIKHMRISELVTIIRLIHLFK